MYNYDEMKVIVEQEMKLALNHLSLDEKQQLICDRAYLLGQTVRLRIEAMMLRKQLKEFKENNIKLKNQIR